MNSDTLGALFFIAFVILFFVMMYQAGRKHYTRHGGYSDRYYSGDGWDGKDEISHKEFENRVAERNRR